MTKIQQLLNFLAARRTGPELRKEFGDVRTNLYRLRKGECVTSEFDAERGVMVYWATGKKHRTHADLRVTGGTPEEQRQRELVRGWFDRNREHRNAYMREYRAKKKARG